MHYVPSHSFTHLRIRLARMFLEASKAVHTERWQGRDISKAPEMKSYELLNTTVHVPLVGRMSTSLARWQRDILPNLPWADEHFAERTGGEPLNPGQSWLNWPWASSADRFRGGAQKQFNHTYMERLWPKYANKTVTGKLDELTPSFSGVNYGIRHSYGDLRSIVELLADEPLTRQAYIPLFFPEDTGIGDGGRKPCTLGYHFMMRDNQLHLYYPLRSCDFIRHYNDDCYLAIRLLLWIIEECAKINPEVWSKVRPGTYTMHATSFHVFANDMVQLRQQYQPEEVSA